MFLIMKLSYISKQFYNWFYTILFGSDADGRILLFNLIQCCFENLSLVQIFKAVALGQKLIVVAREKKEFNHEILTTVSLREKHL